MKSFLLACAFLYLLTVSIAIETEEDCKCWPDFIPESHVDHYHCRGLKNKRLFDCNEPEPPLCKCTIDGRQITLDLGETHCAGLKNAGKNCDNAEEFEELFKRHPHLRLHH